MGIAELLILIVILAIVALILHLLVKALRSRKTRIKIALDKNIPEYDLEELELRELPNGGARMVQRSFEEVMRQASELESLDAAKKRPRSKVLKTDLSREAVLARRAAALAAAEEAAARGEPVPEPELLAEDIDADESVQPVVPPVAAAFSSPSPEFADAAEDDAVEDDASEFNEAVYTLSAESAEGADSWSQADEAALDSGSDEADSQTVEAELDDVSPASAVSAPAWAADAVRADEYAADQSASQQEEVSLTDYSDDDWLDDVSPVRERAVSRPPQQEPVIAAANRAVAADERTEPVFTMMRFDDELGLVPHDEDQLEEPVLEEPVLEEPVIALVDDAADDAMYADDADDIVENPHDIAEEVMEEDEVIEEGICEEDLIEEDLIEEELIEEELMEDSTADGYDFFAETDENLENESLEIDDLEDEETADYFLDSPVDDDDDQPADVEPEPAFDEPLQAEPDDQDTDMWEVQSVHQDAAPADTPRVAREPEVIDDVLDELLHERGVSTHVDYTEELIAFREHEEPAQEIEQQLPEEIEQSIEELPTELPAEDLVQEVPVELPPEVPVELPPEIPVELPPEIPVESPQEEPVELPQEVPEQLPQESPEEIPEETPLETPATTPEEVPAQTPAEVPQEMPEETPVEIPDELPQETPPQELPAQIPDEAPAPDEKDYDEKDYDEDDEDVPPEFDAELEVEPEPQPQPVDSFAAVENKDDIDDLFKDEDQQRRIEALEAEQESTPKRLMSWAGATFGKLTNSIAESRARAAAEKTAREEAAKEAAKEQAARAEAARAESARIQAEEAALRQQQLEQQRAHQHQHADAYVEHDYDDPLSADPLSSDPLTDDFRMGGNGSQSGHDHDSPYAGHQRYVEDDADTDADYDADKYRADDYQPAGQDAGADAPYGADQNDYDGNDYDAYADAHHNDDTRQGWRDDELATEPELEPERIKSPEEYNLERYGESPYKQHQFGQTGTAAAASAKPASKARTTTRHARDNQLSLDMPAEDDFSDSGFSEVLVINVMARPNTSIQGDELLPVLLEAGMRFGEMSIFHRHADRRGGPVLFSMANALNPGTFDLNEISQFTTQGVTFFMTLPNVANNMLAFEQMLATARHVQAVLDADLKDDNRSVMTAQTVEHYRQRIRDFELQQLKNSRLK